MPKHLDYKSVSVWAFTRNYHYFVHKDNSWQSKPHGSAWCWCSAQVKMGLSMWRFLHHESRDLLNGLLYDDPFVREASAVCTKSHEIFKVTPINWVEVSLISTARSWELSVCIEASCTMRLPLHGILDKHSRLQFLHCYSWQVLRCAYMCTLAHTFKFQNHYSNSHIPEHT